jgi:glycosyltransferase involved in cell wall biosynthesis
VTSEGVSVILPSRDRPELLQRALSCALRQEGVELEVIVVDDGSAPTLEGTIDELLDPRVKFVRHAVSHGVASARNAGIACAANPLVAFLDDDDVWAPGKIAAQLDALRSTGAGFSYTGTFWLDADLRPEETYGPCPADQLGKQLRLANVIGTPSAVVARTELVRAVGGFDPRLSVLADWDLWIRLAERAQGAPVAELLLGYVVHSDGMHQRNAKAVSTELRVMREAHPGKPKIGGLGFLQWLASTQRRVGDRLGAARTHATMGLRYRRKRDLGRAIGLLIGERAMRLGRRPAHEETIPLPAWLADLGAAR